MIIKTVREKETTFKLDEPITELFKQMRLVSQKVIENLQPHPYYLQVSHNFIQESWCPELEKEHLFVYFHTDQLTLF